MARTRVRVDGKSVWRASQVVRWGLVLAVVLVVVLDAGSVLMTHMSLSDDSRQAGREAARAVTGLPLTLATAEVGYEAATKVTDAKDGTSVRKSDFEVLPGGGVNLTVVRTAPSLVLKRVPWIAHFGVVVVSTVVDKPVM